MCKCCAFFDGFVNVGKLVLANKQVFIVDRDVDISNLNAHMSTDTSKGHGLIDSSIRQPCIRTATVSSPLDSMMSEYESYVSPENKETTGTQAYVAAEIEQAVSSITDISTSEARSGHLAPTQSATSTSTTPTFAMFRAPQQAKILQTFNDFPP